MKYLLGQDVEYQTLENGKKVTKRGKFLEFGRCVEIVDYVPDVQQHIVVVSSAIIKLPNGKIKNISVDMIKFVDKDDG